MKRILPLLLAFAAAPALAHKDHDHDDAPVIKPREVAPKAEAAAPAADTKKASKPKAAKPKAPATEPAAKPKTGG